MLSGLCPAPRTVVSNFGTREPATPRLCFRDTRTRSFQWRQVRAASTSLRGLEICALVSGLTRAWDLSRQKPSAANLASQGVGHENAPSGAPVDSELQIVSVRSVALAPIVDPICLWSANCSTPSDWSAPQNTGASTRSTQIIWERKPSMISTVASSQRCCGLR